LTYSPASVPYPLSLHDALPICRGEGGGIAGWIELAATLPEFAVGRDVGEDEGTPGQGRLERRQAERLVAGRGGVDRGAGQQAPQVQRPEDADPADARRPDREPFQ